MKFVIKQSDIVRELQTVTGIVEMRSRCGTMTAVLGLAVLLGIGSAAHAQAVEPEGYGEGEIRVAASPREGTRVASVRGVAEVVGSDSSDDAYLVNDRYVALHAREEVSEAVRPYYGGRYAGPWDGFCGSQWVASRSQWGSWPFYAGYYGYSGNYGYYDPLCSTLIKYQRLQSPQVTLYESPVGPVSRDPRGTTDQSRAPSIDPPRVAQSAEWRDQAIREVKGDRAAHRDVQDQSMKRGSRGSEIVRNPRAAPRQVRSLEAPSRNAASMARPAQPRIDTSRRETPWRQVQPRQQSQRSQPQRPQPQQGRSGNR